MNKRLIVVGIIIAAIGTVLIINSNKPSPKEFIPLSKLVRIKGGLVTRIKLESDINEGFHKGDTVYLLKLK